MVLKTITVPKKSYSPAPVMYTFYRGTAESILTSSITWYGACTRACRKTLQCIVIAAEKLDERCLSVLHQRNLQFRPHPKSPLHGRGAHPPITQPSQPAAVRRGDCGDAGQDPQTEGQLCPPCIFTPSVICMSHSH